MIAQRRGVIPIVAAVHSLALVVFVNRYVGRLVMI